MKGLVVHPLGAKMFEINLLLLVKGVTYELPFQNCFNLVMIDFKNEQPFSKNERLDF